MANREGSPIRWNNQASLKFSAPIATAQIDNSKCPTSAQNGASAYEAPSATDGGSLACSALVAWLRRGDEPLRLDESAEIETSTLPLQPFDVIGEGLAFVDEPEQESVGQLGASAR
jgi:hypothetical protein